MPEASTQTGSPKRQRSRRNKAKKQNLSKDSKANQPGLGKPTGAVVALSRKTVSTSPKVTQKNGKSVRIAHRELVNGSVSSNTIFSVSSTYALNPGLAATFPWLAPQAQQGEQYRCHKLRFDYVPIVPTSQAGDIMLVPDYDASDPPPTTETQALDNVGAVTDSVWANVCCDLDVPSMHALGPRRYVRPCNIAGDIKTFDVGTMFICTNNVTTTPTIGKLFVEYDFEFFTPQNSPSGATAPQQSSWYFIAILQTLTTATPVAVNFASTGKIFDPLGVGVPVTGTFTPAAGVYKVEAAITVLDSSAEQLAVLLKMQKNGANLTVPSNIQYQTIVDGTTSSTGVTQMWMGLVTANGTDTFDLLITATGTAGTLTIPAGNASVIWSLA
jgi:hypothetical protein